MLILVGILLGAALAFFYPDSVLWMREGLRPAFAVTMFFVGSLVHPDEVRAFLKAPQRALTGLACQYTIMPLCAFAVHLLAEIVEHANLVAGPEERIHQVRPDESRSACHQDLHPSLPPALSLRS